MTAAPPPSSPAALSLAEEVRRGVSRFVHAVRRRTHSERTAQSETLQLLEREGPRNVAALAARRQVTHQSMRVVVAQLAAQGLVGREPDPADGRSQVVTLSRRGRHALAAERLARAAGIGALIEGVLTEDERRTLAAAVALLDRLSDAAGG